MLITFTILSIAEFVISVFVLATCNGDPLGIVAGILGCIIGFIGTVALTVLNILDQLID